jgi:hypothetical protein
MSKSDRLLLSMVLLLSWASRAHAHEPGEPDAEWYNSLGGHAVGCCGAHHDCGAIGDADYRASQLPDYDYEVRIRGEWIPVPRDALLQYTRNPTGRPVVCVGYRFDHEIKVPWVRCFVLPSEG